MIDEKYSRYFINYSKLYVYNFERVFYDHVLQKGAVEHFHNNIDHTLQYTVHACTGDKLQMLVYCSRCVYIYIYIHYRVCVYDVKSYNI